jgi:hypothetical protein
MGIDHVAPYGRWQVHRLQSRLGLFMDQRTELTEQDLRPQLRWISLLLLIAGLGIAGVALLAGILSPEVFSYFDLSRSYEEGLVFVEENLTAIRWTFTGVGVVEVLIGASLWLWASRMRKTLSGRQATAAAVAAWAGLLGGVTGLANRLTTAWLRSIEELVITGNEAVQPLALIEILAWSVAFVIIGVLIIRGPMPNWLGSVLIVFGLLPYFGFLPLWFFVGAIVLGITGLVRYRGAWSA